MEHLKLGGSNNVFVASSWPARLVSWLHGGQLLGVALRDRDGNRGFRFECVPMYGAMSWDKGYGYVQSDGDYGRGVRN